MHPDEELGRALLQYLVTNDTVDRFIEQFHKAETQPLHCRSICGKGLRWRADKFLDAGHFEDAARTYLEAAEIFTNMHLPSKQLYCTEYQSLTRESEWLADTFDVMACYTGAARALMELKDYTQALLWLCEADAVSLNMRYQDTEAKAWDWVPFHRQLVCDSMQHYHMHKTFADVYQELGNTARMAYHRLYAHKASLICARIPQNFQIAAEASLKYSAAVEYRHPEPSFVHRFQVVDKRSTVLGSWRKLEVKDPVGGIGPRQSAAVFVHKGYMYVAGGEKHGGGVNYKDLWRINLSKLEKWERLADFPPCASEEMHIGYGFAVTSDERAYYFTGTCHVHYYDLRLGRWRAIATNPRESGIDWPFNDVDQFCIECVNDIIYIFGGTHTDATLGSNYMLELNPKTKRWTKLSGDFVPKGPDNTLPGPRHSACSWLSKDKEKIYLLYGDANRRSAGRRKQVGGDPNADTWSYSDFWSWDIPTKKWTREKLVGNVPSPRSEMACVYNRAIDKVITFGGYCPLTSHVTDDVQFSFSYFADTFICEMNDDKTTPEEPASKLCTGSTALVDSLRFKWQQVLTRGFPTYRAKAHLVVDDTTGKTYLFSGYVCTDYIPGKKTHSSKAFNDIWELRIDVPGGNFSGVDIEEEARTARAGPWKRCFFCGSAGPWRKCAGTCNGRASFCDMQCLKDGWKEHKALHDCRKK